MVDITNTDALPQAPKSPRPIVYQSPKVPPRRTPPQVPPKPKPTLVLHKPKFNFNSESVSNDSEEKNETPEIGCKVDIAEDKSNTLQTPAPEASPESTSPVTPPLSPTSTSPSTSQSKMSTPISHPSAMRTASKIPTPLPRKTVNFKSTSNSGSPPNSPTSLDPSIAHCQSKLPTVKARQNVSSRTPTSPEEEENALKFDIVAPALSEPSKSQIPVSVPQPSFPSPPVTPRQKSSGERRHTVVEVCEKVLVPQGEGFTSPPATPFITVARVSGDNENYEVRIDEQNSTALRKC